MVCRNSGPKALPERGAALATFAPTAENVPAITSTSNGAATTPISRRILTRPSPDKGGEMHLAVALRSNFCGRVRQGG